MNFQKMFKSPHQAISLNPTAPPFTYSESTSRSTSRSSSSASSSSGNTTQTSHSTIHKFSTLPPREFIPRNQSHFNPTTKSMESLASDSESQFSNGFASIPSDTTFTTAQDGIKSEDLLLSMKFFFPLMYFELI
jgi:hypothetical protein